MVSTRYDVEAKQDNPDHSGTSFIEVSFTVFGEDELSSLIRILFRSSYNTVSIKQTPNNSFSVAPNIPKPEMDDFPF